MTRSRYHVVAEQSPHFMTATINHWLPLFTRPDTVNIVLDSWRYLQREAGFVLYGYVIMENHLHLIASSPDLSRDMRRFKSYTARAIVDYLQERGSPKILEMLAFFKRPHKTESVHQVWEEGNHPQLISDEAMMRQKLDYMHNNPVKRGYVDSPEHWRYSSARNYLGDEGLIEVTRAW